MQCAIVRATLTALVAGCTVVSAGAANAQTVAVADKIFVGGTILTMNDAQPEAQALAIKDGKIAMVGARAAVEKAHKGDKTDVVDLKGRTLMPGFIDSHSHVILSALKQATVNMDPPPAGNITSIKDIQKNFSEALAKRKKGSKAWLIGWGYDNAMLAENRHPNRDDLDQVSKDVPILVFHFSTHQMVLNSKGLELAGLTANSKDPEGGYIRRREGSQEPNGIVEETAMLPVLAAVTKSLGPGAKSPDPNENKPHYGTSGQPDALVKKLIQGALERYAANGFTTATEFGASLKKAELLRRMADERLLPIDVMAAIIYLDASAEEIAKVTSSKYRNHFRVGGGKVNLDGGTPGRTAFLRKPYFKQMPSEKDYRGYSSIKKQEDMDNLVEAFFAQGIPIYIHAIGDAAIDQAVAAIRHANKLHPASDRRTQLIHMHLVQDDQFKALKDLDVTMTFQITHNFYFADFHAVETLGPERTSRLNPLNTALKNGFSVSIHHDSPVHPIDQFSLIWIAVNRTSRSGKVWGPEEKITVMDALKASTINAAYQFKEEKTKGSIEAGKLADLIIIDQNPLAIDPMKLKDLKVLETIKEGKTIYKSK